MSTIYYLIRVDESSDIYDDTEHQQMIWFPTEDEAQIYLDSQLEKERGKRRWDRQVYSIKSGELEYVSESSLVI